jgi:hypothetical protein
MGLVDMARPARPVLAAADGKVEPDGDQVVDLFLHDQGLAGQA